MTNKLTCRQPRTGVGHALRWVVMSCLLLSYLPGWAQSTLQNGSFEGIPDADQVPVDWNLCQGSPDVLPGVFNITLAPSADNYYLGLYASPAVTVGQVTTPAYAEAISQAFQFKAGQTYTFQVDLAFQPPTDSEGTINNSATLEMWATQDLTACQNPFTEFPAPAGALIFSGTNATATWQTQRFSFRPQQDYNYLILRAKLTTEQGYILIDNLRLTEGDCFNTITATGEAGDDVCEQQPSQCTLPATIADPGDLVYDMNLPLDLSTYLETVVNGVPADQLEWYVRDRPSGRYRKIDDPSAFYFQDWGTNVLRPVYKCPEGGLKFFEPDTFKVEVLDYGLWFLSSDGKSAKFRKGESNAYFDPAKPTVIYVHGWQLNTVKDRFREQLQTNETNEFLARRWREQGWNVAVFYWNQFADDISVFEVEKKIHEAPGGQLAWRKESDLPTVPIFGNKASPESSVTQLFLEAYDAFITTPNVNQSVRLVGHSLGGQLVAMATPLIPPSQRPSRIAFCDPFVSNADYQQAFTEGLTFLKQNGSVLEWYESTSLDDIAQGLASLPSILNLGSSIVLEDYESALKEFTEALSNLNTYETAKGQTAYVKLDATYTNWALGPVELPDIPARHAASRTWYFASLTDPIDPQMVVYSSYLVHANGNGYLNDRYGISYELAEADAISAGTCDEYVRDYFMGVRIGQVMGGETLQSDDDYFLFFFNTAPEQFDVVTE